jgi:hypothetical protein
MAQFVLVPLAAIANPYAAPGGGLPPGADPSAFQFFQQVDTDRSNSVEVAELQRGLSLAFPMLSITESLSRLLVRSFDHAAPPKGSLNFAEFQTCFLQIQACVRFVEQRTAERHRLGQVPTAGMECWWVDQHDLWEMLSAFGFPTTADWSPTRRNVVLAATGSAGRANFSELLRVMAEVKGLIRICQEINVMPNQQPRAISNQELFDFFYRLR